MGVGETRMDTGTVLTDTRMDTDTHMDTDTRMDTGIRTHMTMMIHMNINIMKKINMIIHMTTNMIIKIVKNMIIRIPTMIRISWMIPLIIFILMTTITSTKIPTPLSLKQICLTISKKKTSLKCRIPEF